jgi:hypothetical protein
MLLRNWILCQICESGRDIEDEKQFVFLTVSGPLGSLMPALLSVEDWVPLLRTAQAGARSVRGVALIHYPSYTDSIKPNLQFSCNFVVISASEGSLCFQIFENARLYICIHVCIYTCRNVCVMMFCSSFYYKYTITLPSVCAEYFFY